MTKRSNVRISIYNSNHLQESTKILSSLIRAGYNNMELVDDPYKLLDLYEYHEDTLPHIILVDTDFINEKYNGFDALDEIKMQFKQIIIICLNDKKTLVGTLKSNCDSFVDKSQPGYLSKLGAVVNHWAQYVIERESLNTLYASILN